MARQDIEVRVVDKTAAALNGIQRRLGLVEKNTRNLGRGFDNILGKVVAIGTAIGAGFGLKRIIEVNSQVEQLNLRFAFLFQSVEEGNKAFEGMLDFASKVPFSLEQIAAGAGNLAVASANAEEFSKNLGITGNVAAVFGLNFQQASEQIQRAFSTGIASADIFRERGVSAFLGFQQGARVTARETRERFEEVFGPGGPLADATLVLANTYEGVFSMIQDKFFQFTLALGKQGGIFDFVKSGLKALDTILLSNQMTLESFAEQAGKAFTAFVTDSILGAAKIIDAVTPIFKFVASGIGGLFSIIDSLPSGVKELGIVGFLMLGTTGKLVAIAIGAVLDTIRAGIGYIAQGFGAVYGGIGKVLDLLGVLNDEQLSAMNKAVADFENTAKRLKTPMSELNDAAEEVGETIGGPVERAVRKFLQAQKDAGIELDGTEEKLKEIFAQQGKINTGADETTTKFNEIVENLKFQNSLIGKTTEEQAVLNALKNAEAKIGDDITEQQKNAIANLTRLNFQQKTLNDKLEEEKKLRMETFKDALQSSMDFYEKALGTADITKQEEDKNLALQTINNKYRNGEIESHKEMLHMKKLLNEQYQRDVAQIELQGLKNRVLNEQSILGKNAAIILSDKDREVLKRIGQQEEIEKAVNARIENEKEFEKDRAGFTLGILTDSMKEVGRLNKRAFEAYKALKIAQTIMDTYSGARAAFFALAGIPVVGPALGAIAAAGVVASGLAAVATIRSQNFTGMQRGGTLGAGQSAIVGEDGPELIVPKQPSTVIPREVAQAIEGMGGGKGPVVVNFNITTVDAESFDTLLIRRRGTITSIINGALQKRGKEGVV